VENFGRCPWQVQGRWNHEDRPAGTDSLPAGAAR